MNELMLRDKRGRIWGAMQGLMDGARGRSLTSEETRQWDAWEAQLRQLTADIEKLRADPSAADDIDMRVPIDRSALTGDPAADRAVVLLPEQRMAQQAQDPATFRAETGLTFHRYVRGIVTGDWSGVDAEARAMSTGAGGSGGYLVPSPLSAQVIDKARNAARVLQAGTLTVPMDSAELKIARVAGDPSGAWKAENAAAAVGDMTLEEVKFTSRTLMTIVKASVELVEDANDIDGTIERAIAAALGLELDRAALRGSGVAPEPKGLRNQPGVTVTDLGANGLALTSYDPFSDAVETLGQANADTEALALIMAPRTAGALDRLKDTTNQPLRPPPSYAAISKKLTTNQVPINLTHGTAANASEAYVGDFRQLMIGMRRQLVIEVSRQAADDTDSAFRNLQVWIRAYLRADVQLRHPEHFVVIDGIIP